MIRFYKAPSFIRGWYSSLVWKKKSDHAIYLTFDDGPHPEISSWVDEQLTKFRAKATFFFIGERLMQYPEVAQKLVENGHRLGNHTFSHVNGWKTSVDAYVKEVNDTERLIEDIDPQDVKLFRPPYGRIKRKQIELVRKTNEIYMWDYLSWDFDSSSDPAKSVRKLKKIKPGSIIVFHDSIGAFENLQKILPELLSFYSQKGFKFETL